MYSSIVNANKCKITLAKKFNLRQKPTASCELLVETSTTVPPNSHVKFKFWAAIAFSHSETKHDIVLERGIASYLFITYWDTANKLIINSFACGVSLCCSVIMNCELLKQVVGRRHNKTKANRLLQSNWDKTRNHGASGPQLGMQSAFVGFGLGNAYFGTTIKRSENAKIWKRRMPRPKQTYFNMPFILSEHAIA